jgi:uncharacterized protein GlcG (DUF336 family)
MIRIGVATALSTAVFCMSPCFGTEVVTVHRLSATLAGEAVLAAVAACAQQGYSVTAVVVDIDGVQQATLRGDTAAIHTMEAAYDKAYTSVTSRADTLALVERQKAGTLPPVMLRPLDHLLVGQGGLVIKIGNEVVSGIGVSGSPGGDKDEACARAGLDKIRNRLN